MRRAIELWRNDDTRKFAHVKVREFMAKVPIELYNRIPWVSSICRDIILVSEVECFDLSERPPPSEEPSVNPALDAEPDSANDFIAGISAKMRQ